MVLETARIDVAVRGVLPGRGTREALGSQHVLILDLNAGYMNL